MAHLTLTGNPQAWVGLPTKPATSPHWRPCSPLMGWDTGHEDTIYEAGGSMVSMSLSTVGLGCQAQMCSLGGDKPHFAESYLFNSGFPVGSVVKNLPPVQETWVQSLSQEDPME